MRLFAALLIPLGCVSCGQWDYPVKIPFVATWQGAPISCEDPGTALTDLRFYVSNVQLVDTEGRSHDVRFATEMEWQNDAVAFIDLENGAGACLNGTAELSTYVLGVAKVKEYRGLRFTVGVPFRINHENPLTAEAPLDDPDMHWHWRSGYKFLRAGVSSASDGFWIHVGSAGCEGTVGNITACTFPNRIDVNLPNFLVDQHAVNVDLGALVAGTDLNDGLSTDCSSGPAEEACTGPFNALGITFETGEQTGAQRVFSTQ